ncbi:MAG: DUF3320 domain-containing protein [Deltaproteobacteria bacterium]|nr:DUF3320 domain-containing protein [Deltaproteobacteria bacterium]
MDNTGSEGVNGMPYQAQENSPRIEFDIEISQTVNFAMQQNDVPVVHALRIDNHSDSAMENIVLSLRGEPEFFIQWRRPIALIKPNDSVRIDVVDLKLLPQFLFDLTERVGGLLHIGLSQEGQLLYSDSRDIEILARDEWNGLRSLPDIIAAFVLPNDTAVEKILKSASEILHTWTGNGALPGYQSGDPKHVYTVTYAIYEAIKRLGVSYVSPPASFEIEGQKIRLPHQIFENRLATCLDFSILMASCIEQAGLHPLIIFLENHSFCGVWFQDECFPDCAIDDVIRLRKRVDLNEICAIETTLLSKGSSVTFEDAIRRGKKQLEDEKGFRCVVDILRARKNRIRPLPLTSKGVDSFCRGAEVQRDEEVTVPAPDQSQLDKMFRAIDQHEKRIEQKEEKEEKEEKETRLDRWKRKLLDLSLRNRLLNFKATKKTIPLLCPNLASVEDALADGEEFDVLPPIEPEQFGPRRSDIYEQRTGSGLLDDRLQEDFKSKKLHAELSQSELGKRMLYIFRGARTSLEEGGANTLFLALGFLYWYESDSSEIVRRAPLVLVPMNIKRPSLLEGIRISRSDEDSLINTTLLEMLVRDFNLTIEGLDPIPTDEHGVDVDGIIRIFRETIKDWERWDVREEAYLGLFSFTKYLMWKDLRDRSEDLKRNKVVRHLLETPNEVFSSDVVFPDPNFLDDKYQPDHTFCPLDADSSQLAAVHATNEGRSFVLQGPPGTGKSQTIANIIAHALANKKSVLFVSEKMAALSVVQRRLDDCGLGDFSLELHSNKSKKKDVIESLCKTLEITRSRSQEEWRRLAEKLAETRKSLNEYVQELHKEREIGESVFEGLSKLIELRDSPSVPIDWHFSNGITRDRIDELRESVQQLRTACETLVDVPENHPLFGIEVADYSRNLNKDTCEIAENLLSRTSSLKKAALEAAGILGFKDADWSRLELSAMQEVATMLLCAPLVTEPMLTATNWKEVQRLIEDWIIHGRRRDSLRSDLMDTFTEEVLKLNSEELLLRWSQTEGSFFLIKWFKRRDIRKSLAVVAKSKKLPSYIDITSTLKKVLELQAEDNYLQEVNDRAHSLLERAWQSGEADWDELEKAIAWCSSIRKLSASMAGTDFQQATALRKKWAHIALDAHDHLSEGGAIHSSFKGLQDAWAGLVDVLSTCETALQVNTESVFGSDESPGFLGKITERALNWQEGSGDLRDWCYWRKCVNECCKEGLQSLVAKAENGELRPDQFLPVFNRAFYKWWFEKTCDAVPSLHGFLSPVHEKRIEEFREMDKTFCELTISEIHARLSARVPQTTGDSLPNSEVGILKRERQKKRRQRPIRKLFKEIVNLLPRLKPCLLMSPISVAQYLETDFPPFDLVIFDEASQIPVWDAIGAIARGKEVVVVGDSKQLPPTTFFTRIDGDTEIDEDYIEELESILDECIAARLPTMRLKWHYRSRHESLIAFSNRNYYENKLFTFPSPHQQGGVELVYIEKGIYDKGRSRTNLSEAQAIVETVVDHFSDPERRDRSLGVVTFSIAQQTLIEDLLDDACRENPRIERFFSSEVQEPVFVKNLENVQGDERDFILFSICYGPDENGRVSMNFGPLNKEGGERRLNVAVTRARMGVKVFTSIRADQIDLTRTRSTGVRDLKRYLRYAEEGPKALTDDIDFSTTDHYESPFEKQVCEWLRRRGHIVHTQVGCSSYRIDLAIADPQAQGKYILGVECDGANYHSASTARDRDRLRELVLRGLGWHIVRVWSRDWWENPQKQIDKIEKVVEQIRSDPSGMKVVSCQQPLMHTHRSDDAPFKLEATSNITTASKFMDEQQYDCETYEAFKVIPFPFTPWIQQDFYDASSIERIRNLIEQIVAKESPIHLDLLARRVVAHWHFSRVTMPAIQRIRSEARRVNVNTRETEAGVFYWAPDQNPEDYRIFRIPGDSEDSKRRADELAPEEVANAALQLMRRNIRVPEEELARGVAKLFGYNRLGRIVKKQMILGIKVLVERKCIEKQDDSYALLEGGE